MAKAIVRKWREWRAVARFRWAWSALVFATVSWVWPHMAFAQESVQDRANPAQLEDRVPRHSLDAPRADLPDLRETVDAQVADQELSGKIIVGAVQVEGATALGSDALRTVYEPYLARALGQGDLAALAQALTDAYREAGFFLSYAVVPPQAVVAGILRLRVVEGRLAELEITGGGAPALLRGYFKNALEEVPLRLSTLEKAIVLVNDLPGITVSDSRIDRLDSEGSQYRLSLTVVSDRLDGVAYVDNRGTREVGRVQLWLAAGLNGLLKSGDRTQLGVFTIPADPSEFKYVELSHRRPLTGRGLTLDLKTGYGRAEPGGVLKNFEIESESFSFEVALSQPLLRDRRIGLWLRGGMRVDDIEQAQQDSLVFRDKIRAVDAGLDLVHVADGSKVQTHVGLTLSKGFDIFAATDSATERVSRRDGRADFAKIEAWASHSRPIDEALLIEMAVSGQWAAEPLLSSEEFALGGAVFARAFDYYEVTGDHGAAISAGPRYRLDWDSGMLASLSVYGFVDYGFVIDKGAIGDARTRSLASVGGGLTAQFRDDLTANLELGAPIKGTPFQTGHKDPRLFIWLAADF